MEKKEFGKLFAELSNFEENQFHPLVWINGTPIIGENVYIGGMSEVNAKGAKVIIGDNCDIASFVAINCADSHRKSIGLSMETDRKDILIENNVFIGSHSVIKGGAHIGHHSVVAAGTIVESGKIPPYSLVVGNPMKIKAGYYLKKEDLKIQHNKPTIGYEEENTVIKVLRSGWLAQGKEVEEFENEFCNFMGLPKGHAVAVSSGTAALYLALEVLEGKNKSIALPSYTCSAISNAIDMVQGKKIYVDSNESTPNIDLLQLQNSDPDIGIIPHMYGIPQDISNISNIKVIEDCAQAIGAKVNNQYVGLQGDIGIFSFYATKMLTSGGQGGMIISKNIDLIEKVRDYREFDQRSDMKSRFNFQMTDVQASIGRVQLKKLPSFIRRREEIYMMYQEAGLELLDDYDSKLKPVRYRAIIKVEHPQSIIEELKKYNINVINPLEEWELLGESNLSTRALTWTKKTISLPIYPELTDEEVRKVIKIVKGV